MVLSKTVQQDGTDFVDAHNKENLDRIDAIMTQVDLLSEDTGHVAQACLFLATLPTDTNTVTIGSDVYEFEGVGANINVLKGASAAESRANLVIAINNEGTELVFADQPTTPADQRAHPARRPRGRHTADRGWHRHRRVRDVGRCGRCVECGKPERDRGTSVSEGRAWRHRDHG